VNANTVIAICSVVIAVASLGVSAYVAWATRRHNRLSVRPLLGLTTTFVVRAPAGLRLTNSGPSPHRQQPAEVRRRGAWGVQSAECR
jgi:hypothetical protein